MLFLEEQLVAPVDRGTHRAMAIRKMRFRRAQWAEPVVQPLVQFVERQSTDPRRGQLDCQWQSFQLAANPSHRRGIVLPSAKVGSDSDGPIDEELHRLACLQLLPGRTSPTARASGSTGYCRSPRSLRGIRLVTTTRSLGARESSSAIDRGSRQEMLEVVENEHDVAALQRIDHRVETDACPASRSCMVAAIAESTCSARTVR